MALSAFNQHMNQISLLITLDNISIIYLAAYSLLPLYLENRDALSETSRENIPRILYNVIS